MRHELKIWPKYFDAVDSGAKTFEVRATDDRTFAVGDGMLLREWDPDTKEYTGRVQTRDISYVLDGLFWNGNPCAILGFTRPQQAPAAPKDYADLQQLRRLACKAWRHDLTRQQALDALKNLQNAAQDSHGDHMTDALEQAPADGQPTPPEGVSADKGTAYFIATMSEAMKRAGFIPEQVDKLCGLACDGLMGEQATPPKGGE